MLLDKNAVTAELIMQNMPICDVNMQDVNNCKDHVVRKQE
jgi:hypothetical protein